MCIVPFRNPPIAPTDDEEQDSFDQLDDLLTDGDLSSACGWVIKVGSHLDSRQEVQEMIKYKPHCIVSYK